jgi:uncharacterized membrane protein YhaH (DUF805 family)
VAAPLTAREEVREATAHGGLYLRRLRRAQLSVSLLALVVFAGLVGALPLVILLVERLRDIEVFGVPATVGLVVVPPYVLLVALGWLYERRANGLDSAFRELLDDDEP